MRAIAYSSSTRLHSELREGHAVSAGFGVVGRCAQRVSAPRAGADAAARDGPRTEELPRRGSLVGRPPGLVRAPPTNGLSEDRVFVRMPGPMRTYRIAAIPGDGIGVEVIAAGLRALEALARSGGTFRFEVENFPWSSDYYLEHGHYIPEGGLQKLRGFDAIFFGAVGSRSEEHTSELQSLAYLVCRLLLEKKKKKTEYNRILN